MCMIVCAGPPFCSFSGEACIKRQNTGCTLCRRFPCGLAIGEDLPRLSVRGREGTRDMIRRAAGDKFDEDVFQMGYDVIEESRMYGGIH